MHHEDRLGSDDVDGAVKLLIASARDLVTEIRAAGRDLDRGLREAAEIDAVIAALSEKKKKVEILKEVARQITSRLRVGSDGKVGVQVSEETKREFTTLMAEFRQMLEEEERLEEMMCGRGLQISRRSKK